MLNAYFDPFLFLKLLLFSCKKPIFNNSVDGIDKFIYAIILFLVSTKPTIVINYILLSNYLLVDITLTYVMPYPTVRVF